MREYVRVWIVLGLGLAALGVAGFAGLEFAERYYSSREEKYIFPEPLRKLDIKKVRIIDNNGRSYRLF